MVQPCSFGSRDRFPERLLLQETRLEECVLSIRLRSNVSSEKSKRSSPSTFFHSSSNGLKWRILRCTQGGEFWERIRYSCSNQWFCAYVCVCLPRAAVAKIPIQTISFISAGEVGSGHRQLLKWSNDTQLKVFTSIYRWNPKRCMTPRPD